MYSRRNDYLVKYLQHISLLVLLVIGLRGFEDFLIRQEMFTFIDSGIFTIALGLPVLSIGRKTQRKFWTYLIAFLLMYLPTKLLDLFNIEAVKMNPVQCVILLLVLSLLVLSTRWIMKKEKQNQ